jgi:hypothetical protein
LRKKEKISKMIEHATKKSSLDIISDVNSPTMDKGGKKENGFGLAGKVMM